MSKTDIVEQEAGALSHLSVELDAFRKENERLRNSFDFLMKELNELRDENKKLRDLRFSDDYKKHWRMVYAGQAMQSIIETKPNFKDVAEISKSAFIVADSMIEQISV